MLLWWKNGEKPPDEGNVQRCVFFLNDLFHPRSLNEGLKYDFISHDKERAFRNECNVCVCVCGYMRCSECTLLLSQSHLALKTEKKIYPPLFPLHPWNQSFVQWEICIYLLGYPNYTSHRKTWDTVHANAESVNIKHTSRWYTIMQTDIWSQTLPLGFQRYWKAMTEWSVLIIRQISWVADLFSE